MTPEQEQAIVQETGTYLLIALAAWLAFSVLSLIIPAFSILSIACVVMMIYFGINLYGAKLVVSRKKNSVCDSCGTNVLTPSTTTWQEVGRRWVHSANSVRASAVLYVTVRFHCRCPNCGTEKTFTKTLSSGSVRVTDFIAKDDLKSTQTVVEAYIGGRIHV